MARRYKCPYCEDKYERQQLIDHVDKKHEDLIPEGFTAERVVFNLINKRECGYCRVCHKETDWNPIAGKYNVLCNNPKCKEALRKQYQENMIRVRGTDNILNDPEQQKKMLANRSISGKYKFTDGGILTYTGSYEKKCLEFMDKVLEIPSKDILSPGPTLEYEMNGEKHFYITDFYLIPQNLIIEVKDGGDNLNTKDTPGMRSSRERTLAKEKLITESGEYNYVRLTNNDFAQLIDVLMEIKKAQFDKIDGKIIKVNESVVNDRITLKIPEEIIEFNKELNSYDYGILINDKVKTGKDIDFTKYKTISIKDFEKYHTGVCWDFVNYEAKWFKDHSYKFSTYYIQIDDNKNCPSHTFLIFNYKGKYYYFESSWFKYQGIEEFNSEIDAVNTVIKRHNEAYNKDNKYKIYCWKYNTNGLDSGLNVNDYMNKIYSSGKEININESYINESGNNINLYHLSTNNLDSKILKPRIPDNFLVKNGYENSTIKRVCFATSIDKCLRAMSYNIKGIEFYVHIPDKKYNTYKPSVKEVPDCKITGEIWIREPVKLKCIGKIKVIKDKGEPGLKYQYGDKEAELYDWDYEWVEKINESYVTENNIINNKDLEFNLDKWKPGNKNILFITGLSGSGKSTKAAKLAKEYNAVNIELDLFEHNYVVFDKNVTNDEGNLIVKEYFENKFGGAKKFKQGDKQLPHMMYDFIKYCMNYAYKHKDKLFIIEGIQLSDLEMANEIKDYPIIIVRTSIINSIYRAAKREGIKNYIKSFESYKDFLDLYKWYLSMDKNNKKFAKELEESYITESHNITLYHGSTELYSTLKSTGIDLGNTFQKPGWSLFTWTKYDSAVGWAVFCVFKRLSREYDIQIKGCLNSQTTVIPISSYNKLVNIIDDIDPKLKTYYVYTVKPDNSYEFGLGHSSNTPNCITIRNCNIKPYRTEEHILTLDDINRYCKIVSDDYTPTDREYGKNGRLLSFLMKYDFMYNGKVKKQLSKDVDAGLLNVGDDIVAYINNSNIQVNKVTLLDRVKSIITNESVVTESSNITLYHGTDNPDFDIIEPNSYNVGTHTSKPRMSSYWFDNAEYAKIFATMTILDNNLPRDKNGRVCLDNNMSILVPNKYMRDTINLIKNNSGYVYYRTIDKSIVSRGHARYFPEYTIDVPVKPDGIIEVKYKDMINHIRFVNQEYYDEVMHKYATDNIRYDVSVLQQIFDIVTKYPTGAIPKKKKQLNKYAKFNSLGESVEGLSDEELDYLNNYVL